MAKAKRKEVEEEIKEVIGQDLTKKRDDECLPVAREILRVIGEIYAECLIGDMNIYLSAEEKAKGMTGAEKGQDYYRKIVEDKIMPVLEKANIRTHDVNFITQIVMQPFDFLKGSLIETFEIAEDNAVAAKFGVKHQNDIRISDIIAAQKEALEKKA